jgi:endoglycosylceramidase
MWGDFWEFIAQRFVNNEFVIGYELINEPWAGNIWKNISLLAPGNAERVFLQKAYNYVSGRIRDIDDRHIIFFEPVTWDNIFPTGFSEPPGGPSYANRSIFSYHYYSPPDVTAQSTIYSSFKDSRFLNVGGMLTELAIQKDGAFPKSSVKAFKSCDRYRQSWILWTYKPFFPAPPNATSTGCVYYPNGTAIPDVVGNMTRTYPQAVAGKTISFTFTPLSGQFYLEYNICLECGSTDIYVN